MQISDCCLLLKCVLCVWEQRKRQAVQAVYESQGLPQDHKVEDGPHGAQWGLGT
jgi:hypothetical protein